MAATLCNEHIGDGDQGDVVVLGQDEAARHHSPVYVDHLHTKYLYNTHIYYTHGSFFWSVSDILQHCLADTDKIRAQTHTDCLPGGLPGV